MDRAGNAYDRALKEIKKHLHIHNVKGQYSKQYCPLTLHLIRNIS